MQDKKILTQAKYILLDIVCHYLIQYRILSFFIKKNLRFILLILMQWRLKREWQKYQDLDIHKTITNQYTQDP